MRALFLATWTIALILGVAALAASDLDEFKIKRQELFEFARKPHVTRSGDRVEIFFESKGFCDATVAIEDAEGRIVRHLASGVLGPNAPEPWQKNSLAQALAWDGKDDQGRYLDDKAHLSVRVALGLQTRFERNLLWRPKLRQKRGNPLLCAAPEGVYVFEGCGVDHLRLFSHDGEYLRTVYPFPGNQVGQVQGLDFRTAPQDGLKIPFKTGFMLQTLLTSGASGVTNSYSVPMTGSGALAMAVRGERIALAQLRLNRLATNGSSGGLALEGGSTNFPTFGVVEYGGREKEFPVGPTSMAFSPDGKTLYMTGYLWAHPQNWDCLNGVTKLDYEHDTPATVFAGSMKQNEAGNGDQRFNCPSSVDCDAQGRVYVSDFMNDRVQILSPDGKLLKSIGVFRPAQVLVNPKTQEIYVFSWVVYSRALAASKTPIDPKLAIFAPFEDPRKKFECPLPVGRFGGAFNEYYETQGVVYMAALDAWTETPAIWLAKQGQRERSAAVPEYGVGAGWDTLGIQVFSLQDGKLNLVRNFGDDLKKTSARTDPPYFGRQRLFVNPRTQLLYEGNDMGYSKSFKQLLELDPHTGKDRFVELPLDAEDLCFDLEGLAYLRTDTVVARYDPQTWREVPWDYGEEFESHGFSNSSDGRRAKILSGLPTPGRRPVCWNQGGLSVSAQGHLAVSCASRSDSSPGKGGAAATGRWSREAHNTGGKPYTPAIYPGRTRYQEIHVWDKHGKIVYKDAVPGLGILDGLAIDRDDNLYVMAGANRLLDGKPYFNDMGETVMKFKPNRVKVLSTLHAVVPLPVNERPKKPAEVFTTTIGEAWANAEWFYGGAGYGGFNTSRAGGGCACWNARFCLDYFARSFAPEVDHFSVAVLDSNGNLILRVGQYGNVDDGMPLLKDGGPSHPRALGGDEVALFHAAYVATFTDRRLFIADAGNGRIVGVKLGYHAEERVPLKGVADTSVQGATR